MKRFCFVLFYTLWVFACEAQYPKANRLGRCENRKFDREVASWLSFSLPAVDVDSLRRADSTVLILDAREPEEYAVGHIPGAVNCGYDHFDISSLDSIAKNRPIFVYCSIGYRSEKIGQKLQKKGFKKVSNLYGSIFEWVNRGYPLEDEQGMPTRRLHTFNKSWARWVDDGKCEKVH